VSEQSDEKASSGSSSVDCKALSCLLVGSDRSDQRRARAPSEMIDAEARMDVNAAAAVPVRSIAFTAGLFLCPVKSSQLFM
jgi:hypothetical protein